MTYYVTVGDRAFEIAIDGDVVVVNGRRVDAAIAQPHDLEVLLTMEGVRHALAIDAVDQGTVRLVDARGTHEAMVEDERTRHIRLLVAPAKRSTGLVEVRAPMPGLVVRIRVAAGDQVEAGNSLVDLEAMKMENEIKAPAAGTVRAVHVEAGQAVEKGKALVDIAASV